MSNQYSNLKGRFQNWTELQAVFLLKHMPCVGGALRGQLELEASVSLKWVLGNELRPTRKATSPLTAEPPL